MTLGEHRLGAAPWANVADYAELADDFMLRVFNVTPYDYMITDDSSLLDFVAFDQPVAEVYAKIQGIYGVDVSSVPRGNMLGVLRLIAVSR